MRRLLTLIAASAFAGSLLLAGCSQSAPAPAATKAPAAPAAAEPTKAAAAPTTAPAAAPTTAPAAAPTAAKKVDYPAQGRSINMIVPWPAGGGVDIGTRLLAPYLEKELGIPVQVSNKAGASGQIGEMEMLKSKPDGYTICATLVPGTITVYLDQERKATYGRKDFQPIALHVSEPAILVVKGDSPYKTAKEFVEAAKANPEKVKVSSSGIMSPAHMATIQFEKVTGTKFAIAQFDGAAPALTALLGGHVDANIGWGGNFVGPAKSGDIRVLGVMDSQRSQFFPNVPTMGEIGYKVSFSSARGFSVPAGTPKEIVGILDTAFKKAINNDEHKKKIEEASLPLKYMDSAGYGTYWDETEAIIKPMMVNP
jgi:tripartite-type tricarboxylate transporter receptor subunit TctC